MKCLIVVDMQNDFITGPLGTPEAHAIISKVADKIRWAKENGYRVIFTKDTHYSNYMDTQEGKLLPVPHCIKGTEGHDLNMELVPLAKECRIYEKETFGSYTLAYDIMCDDVLDQGHVEEIVLVGVCTDICVISNAILIKNRNPEIKIIVDASCCAGTTPEMHNKALDVMQSCQIYVENRQEDKNER